MEKANIDHGGLGNDDAGTDKTTQATSSKLQDQETHRHQEFGITESSSRSHQENQPEEQSGREKNITSRQELEAMISSKATALKKGKEELDKYAAELKIFIEMSKESAHVSMNPKRKRRLIDFVYNKSEENDSLSEELKDLKTKLLSVEKDMNDGKMTKSLPVDDSADNTTQATSSKLQDQETRHYHELGITGRASRKRHPVLYHIAQQEMEKMKKEGPEAVSNSKKNKVVNNLNQQPDDK